MLADAAGADDAADALDRAALLARRETSPSARVVSLMSAVLVPMPGYDSAVGKPKPP